jgi:hypothetical protein
LRHFKEQSMQRALALTVVLGVALAVTGYAQKTDFSGTWAIDQAATDAAAAAAPAPPAGAGGGGRGFGQGPMTIKQTPDSITLVRQGQGGRPVTATYKLDGTEQDVVLGAAGQVKARAKWDGQKVVIESVHTGQGGDPVTTWLTLQLDDKGTLWAEQKNPNATFRRAFKKTN